MNKYLLILSLFIALSGCKNKSENQMEAEKNTPIEETNPKEEQNANSADSFSIKLNTIYGENGLEDYSKDAQEVFGKVMKQLQGSDGSEYYLVKLDKTLVYKELDKAPLLNTNYLIIGGRFQESPLKKGANKTVVNVAIVKDETLINDALLDFKKAIFAGIGEATEIK